MHKAAAKAKKRALILEYGFQSKDHHNIGINARN
jgi:hypothetical protein